MTLRAAEQDLPTTVHARACFTKQIQSLDLTRLVFIDEGGAMTNTVRRYGRAPVGQRAHGKMPVDYAQLTMTGALSLEQGFFAPDSMKSASSTNTPSSSIIASDSRVPSST